MKQFKALAPNTAALLLSSDDDKTKILCVAIVPVVCTYVHTYICTYVHLYTYAKQMLLYPQYMYMYCVGEGTVHVVEMTALCLTRNPYRPHRNFILKCLQIRG